MNQQYYTVDLFEPLTRFRDYQRHYINTMLPEREQTAYLHMLIEQLVAHFDVEATAVTSFMAHYTALITDPSVSPRFQYHPLRFLKPLSVDALKHYVYCLYGLAEELFRLFQTHGLFVNGRLIASYQHIEADVLHLVIRKEVSDVFLY